MTFSVDGEFWVTPVDVLNVVPEVAPGVAPEFQMILGHVQDVDGSFVKALPLLEIHFRDLEMSIYPLLDLLL